MRGEFFTIIILLFLFSGCHKKTVVTKEPWIDKPVTKWPDFALTSKISFKDTTYMDLANAFLVNTGYDTIGVSCKHLFLVFEVKPGLSSIDLGNQFKSWQLYPESKPDRAVTVKKLINTNNKEPIDQFNTLKDRDWIILELQKKRTDLYPLKIRFEPVKTDEIVYAVGWGDLQSDRRYPAVIKLQCFKNMGNYFYVTVLDKQIKPNGRSGSPVIDKNGYLVGLISGAEGNLGVVGSVQYLSKLFDRYGIKYKIENQQ